LGSYDIFLGGKLSQTLVWIVIIYLDVDSHPKPLCG
jgi:hypothetical protein